MGSTRAMAVGGKAFAAVFAFMRFCGIAACGVFCFMFCGGRGGGVWNFLYFCSEDWKVEE